MFDFTKLEKLCSKHGFVIELRKDDYRKKFYILTYQTQCKAGLVKVGYFKFDDVITQDGKQYVKKITMTTKLEKDIEENKIEYDSWRESVHECYLFLIGWRLKKFRREIDDFDSHNTFLVKYEKKQKATKLEEDAKKDFN